jgi:hypothetical protein
MIPVSESIVEAAKVRAKEHNDSSITLDVSLRNQSEKSLRVYGSYEINDRERLLPSVNVYSWEKVFYGVENQAGLSDTRYDIKVPAATLVPTKKDLSDLPGLQNGVVNMAVLIAPNSVPSSPVGPKLIAHHELGSVIANSPAGANIPVSLEGLSSTRDSIWVLALHGRSRMQTGNACPGAEIETVYSGPKSTYTYKSAWSPRRLGASSEWKDFEFVVPIKPTVDSAAAQQATATLKLTAPDSPYLNIQKTFTGQCEFAGLTLDVYQLPSNPIGLGHQVY